MTLEREAGAHCHICGQPISEPWAMGERQYACPEHHASREKSHHEDTVTDARKLAHEINSDVMAGEEEIARAIQAGFDYREARLRSSVATAERERASAVEQYERTHQELAGYVARAEELGVRTASLQGLLTEAVPELREMAAAADAFPRYADHARVTVVMGICRRARALLTRIEAREGGEESA